MAEEWQTQKFRQSVIAKINELTQNTTMDPTKNATMMENHIFKKARSREEYLGLVAKLFMHFRELNNRPGKPPAQNTNNEMGNNIMQDPINALQNLASQGSRNNQMMTMGNQGNQMQAGSVIGGNVAASNLLQTLTQQQRPGPQIQNMQGIRGQMNVTMGSSMPQTNMGPTNIGPNTMNAQMGNAMGNMNTTMNINAMNAMNNQAAQMANCLPGQMNQIPPGQMQLNASMQGQQMPTTMGNVPQMPMNSMNQNQMNIGMNHPQLNQMIGRLNANPGVNVVPPNVSQSQINVSGANTMNSLNTQPQQMNQQTVVNANAVAVAAAMGQNTNQMNPAAGAGLNQIIQIQQQQMNNNQINSQQQQKPPLPPISQQQQQQLQQTTNPNVVGNNANIFQANRNQIAQNHQFLRQSPSPQTAAVPSPAGLNQQQMQNTQMIPSPALVPSPSPQMANIMANNQRNLRQSPNAPLNTPGQVSASSPFNAQEDQLYREKYKQLTKYIEPLKRMVAKIGNDDVEKITKMNKLLEILCNPHQRIPLETLLKCEKALEKMDFKSCLFVPSSTQFGSNNPLLEALNSTLQSSIANHTLQRTFRPCLEALFGTDIRSVPYTRKESIDDYASNTEIPHVLQGEIARLDQKFKISLDPSSQNNNKNIKLICCLDDKRLPCVPPVSVSIPEEYPLASPSCSLTEQEYSSTPFLIAVQDALTARISKLPKLFSLSHLLDIWEMSVRQACSPNAIAPCEFTTSMGI